MTWENQQTGQHLSVFFCPEAWYTIYRKVKAGPAPEEPARRALLRRRVLFGNQFLKGRIAGTALAPYSGPGGPKAACASGSCRFWEAFSQKAESRARRLPPTRGMAAQKPPARLASAASGKPLPKRQNRGRSACPFSGHGGPKAACASCSCRFWEAFSQKAESRARRLPPTRGLAAQKPPARLAPAAGS